MTLNKQTGISLLEVLLAVAIGATIITMSVRYFTVTQRNSHVLQAMQQIKLIAHSSYAWLSEQKQPNFSDSPSGTNISRDLLVEAKLLPENTQYNPWGGDITLAPSTRDPSYITITMSGLPNGFACQNLKHRLQNIAHDHGSCTPPDNDNGSTPKGDAHLVFQYQGDF